MFDDYPPGYAAYCSSREPSVWEMLFGVDLASPGELANWYVTERYYYADEIERDFRERDERAWWYGMQAARRLDSWRFRLSRWLDNLKLTVFGE